MADLQHAPASPEMAHRQPEPAGAEVEAEVGGGARTAGLALAARVPAIAGPRPGPLPPGAMGAAVLLGVQRSAGNLAAATLVRGVSASVPGGRRAVAGPGDPGSAATVSTGSSGTRERGAAARAAGSARRPTRLAVQRLAPDGSAEPREEDRSSGSGDGSQVGQSPAATTAEPTEAADAAQAGADKGAPAAVAEGGEGPGSAEADGGPAVAKIDAAEMDEQTAALVADFLAEFGSRLDEVKGPAAMLADPAVRSAAARLVPDREELVPAGVRNPPAAEEEASPQHASSAVIQRDGKGTKKVPTQKVKVTIPGWPKIPLFKDRNVGSWFLLSGVVESPAYEGEAKPPDDIRDDTTEQELQLTADGKVKGYAATFHKETLAKTGNTELEGKVAVEVTDEAVKVSGLSLKLPDLGGSSNVLLEGQFDFDLLDWPTGEPPGVMVLSYTQKIGVKSSFTTDGWAIKGQLSLPLKVSIKPNPAKVAEYVARVIGPRLAAAAPAGLAIAAPLVAGGVCIALWVNAIQAGEDIATAMDSAKLNTLGYVTAYFNTIMGYTSQRYSNAGSAAGTAAAQRVLDGLRWSELPAGAQEKIRAEYIKEGTMDLPGVQASMWKQYRAAAIEWYRKEHGWDAWAYDKGLPSDLRTLIKDLDIVGPPWPVSAY